MAVIRVEKNKNYTTMSNYHLRDKRLSLRAKGLLSEMLSLPDDWNYSIAGLASINKEKEDSIKSILKELKDAGYLIMNKLLPSKENGGKITYEYVIHEKPVNQEGENQHLDEQHLDCQPTDVQPTEKPRQLNTNILNTNLPITDLLTTDLSKEKEIYKEREEVKPKKFTPPTLEEVREYCLERNNNVDPEQFFSYYQEGEWKDSKGNPVKNWKQKVITWEKNDYKPNRNNISKPTEQSKTYNPVTEWKRQNGFKENPWL